MGNETKTWLLGNVMGCLNEGITITWQLKRHEGWRRRAWTAAGPGSRAGGVMRIRRAIVPAILALGMAGAALTSAAGATHVAAMHCHGRPHVVRTQHG